VKGKYIRRVGRLHFRIMSFFLKEMERIVTPWIDKIIKGLHSNPDFVVEPPFPEEDFNSKLLSLAELSFANGYFEAERFEHELQLGLNKMRESGSVVRSFSDPYKVLSPSTNDPNWRNAIGSDALDWLRTYTPSLVRVYKEDTLKNVRNNIARGIYKGQTKLQRMKAIQQISEQTKEFSKHRLETIMRSETMRACNMGSVVQMRRSPAVRGVEFSCVMDNRVTAICEQRHGLRVAMDDPNLPSNTPPLHPNCRSILIPVMIDEVPRGWKGDSEELARLTREEPPIQREVDREAQHRTHQDGNAGPESISDIDLQKILDAEKSVQDILDEGIDELLGEGSDDGFDDIGDMDWDSEYTFSPANSIEEAEAWAVENGLAREADYRNIRLELANEWNRGVYENMRRARGLKKMDFIGSAQVHHQRVYEKAIQRYAKRLAQLNPNVAEADLLKFARKQIAKPKIPSDVYALAREGSMTGVSLNEKYGKQSLEKLNDILRLDVEAGLHPVGTERFKSIIDHEMGHRIDSTFKISDNKEIVDLWLSSARDDKIKSELSEYAETNLGEFIAEGWSEYLNNPVPRPLSRRIGAIIERLIRNGGVK
jgi:SPP1 gp7 family putative phage head morphogenesis protein